MKSEDIKELFQRSFNLICPLCNQQYGSGNYPIVVCYRQHHYCWTCVNTKIFKNVYINTDIAQCPGCSETIKRSQAKRLNIFQNILQFRNSINEIVKKEESEQIIKKYECDEIEEECLVVKNRKKILQLDQIIKQQTQYRRLRKQAEAQHDHQQEKGSIKIRKLQNWLLNEAEKYFLQAKFENAIQICKNIIENNPNNGCMTFQGFGSKEDFIGYEQEQIKKTYKSYMTQVKDRSPYDLLSLCLLLSSDYEEDKSWYLVQLQKNKRNYQLHFGLGLLESNFDNHQKAIQQFQAVLDLNQSNFEKADQCIAFSYYAMGDLLTARKHAQQSLAINPDNIYSLYIRAMTNQDQSQKIKQLEQLTIKAPQYLVPLHELGQIYFIKSQTQKAMQCYKTCLVRSQFYDFARNSLGLCYLRENQPQKVIELFQNNPMAEDNEQTLEIIAESYCKIGLIKQTHQAISKCKKINPDNKKIDYILGSAYELEGKIDQAINVYIQILKKIDQKDQKSGLLKLIVLCNLKRDDYQKARLWDQVFRKLEPDNTELLVKIANYLFDHQLMESALQLYLQCYEINRSLMDFASKLIDIYSRKHMYEEALHWAQKWNSSQPDNPDSWEALSLISKTIGDKIRSKQWQPRKKRHTN